MLTNIKLASDRPASTVRKSPGEQVLQRIVSAMLIFCIALAFPYESSAATKKKSSGGNPKYASIVIDAASGTVLSESNADKSLHPASLTKVMTLLMLFEALENGNVRLNDKIFISKHAAAQQPSKLGIAAGGSIRVEDAILAVVTKSANDIATAIGEHLAGSEGRFALRMTRRAHDIGMSRTTFRNASGLHDPGQVTSARDMAILARYILFRYPNYYRYFGTKQFTYRGKTMTNHNRLMNSYPGMDGFKTGFINASGFNLIASAKQDGRRLIGVVFGGRSWKTRNDHMAVLLNTGFSKARDIRYAQERSGNGAGVAVAAAPVQPPMPLPTPKPVLKPTANTLQLPEQRVIAAAPTPPPGNFTSLSSLETGRKLVLDTALPPPQNQVTAQAVANAQRAIDSGEYSELTGEGDYDPGTARRVETGLIAAAVYKGEHDRVEQIQQAARPPAAPAATAPGGQAQHILTVPAAAVQPQPAPSDLWSVQIGAYNSRVATDDALRQAIGRLPPALAHASPQVVPLNTAEGTLFRARLGNFTQEQASAACRYFRDCLPVSPR